MHPNAGCFPGHYRAQNNDPVLTSYEAYGFCGAMPKPYQKDDLEKVLSNALNL
jgi:hypothetical protein